MSAIQTGLPGSGSFARGLHPPGRKELSAPAAIEVIVTAAELSLPLLQHTGAPAEPLVKPRQEVAGGEMIAQAAGFVSAPVHAPLAGVVQMMSVTTLPNGRHVKTVPIKPAAQQPAAQAVWEDVFGGDWPKAGLDKYEPTRIIEAVQKGGLVGLGGAAFPTHVKLTRNAAKPIDTLLVNGCECEPYLTADYRLMLEAPDAVVVGALLAARAAGAGQVVIAIEDNKPDAAERMRQAVEGTPAVVKVVKTKYPMGGERQVIPAVLKRAVPTGGLPLDVGVVVVNVGTAAAVARAVVRGKGLTHRVITVTGAGVRQPKNLLVPLGISYAEAIAHCGGLRDEAARVVAGGPMMGFALGSLDVPVTKGTSGVTVLTHEDIRRSRETACVRCGRCVDSCPLRLVPTKMAQAAKAKDWELARRYQLMACCECGCCAYICPARIPLAQLIRLGKAQMPRK